MSYTIRVDPKPEIDKETGKDIIKPQIFADSAMDNPQTYGYLKFSRENRKNKIKTTNFEMI